MISFFVSLRLCVIKIFGACVVTHIDAALPQSGTKKPDLFRSGFLPLSRLATNYVSYVSKPPIVFSFCKFSASRKAKKSLEITREFHPDDAGLDNDIVKRAARWC
jgi:hypothetical protein